MGIEENYRSLMEEVPEGVKVVAVSKTRTPEEIMQLYDAGHRIMGENKVQELMEKRDRLPSDMEWHMVGHLQSNKVKYIAPFIHLIHSADSLNILKKINREAIRNNRTISVLLQMHIAREDTKFGLDMDELEALLGSGEIKELQNIRICGLMGMATFTEDLEMVRSEFRMLAGAFNDLKQKYFKNSTDFCHLSMGMTGDYRIALEEGSTMLRIGTRIFGERNDSCKIK